MTNKTIIGVLVALVVVGGLAWWGLSNKTTVENIPEETTNTSPTTLTVNHYYQVNNGMGSHTLEGTITLPTPCHSLSVEAEVAPSVEHPEDVLVKFITKPGGGICTQVLSDKFFRVTFNAGEDAQITATLDGRPITLIFSENKEGITK